MKLNSHKYALGISFALALVGCGGGGFATPATPGSVAPQIVDGPPFLGESYTIAGKRYEPKDDNAFDQVGYARVFGESKRGAATSNGEQVNPDLIEVAHQILPAPSYVEITHLETGRTILARVNNRGPMSTSAIAELSPAAARQLGMDRASAPVRVRRVNPPVPERAALRSGLPTAARLDTPPALLSALRRKMKDEGIPVDNDAFASSEPVAPRVPARPPAARPVSRPSPGGRGADFGVAGTSPTVAQPAAPDWSEPAPARPAAVRPVARGAWYVQLAAFGKQPAAEEMAQKAGARAFLEPGGIWRVRAGPYPNETVARSAVKAWQERGYPNARADFGAAGASAGNQTSAPNSAPPPTVASNWHVQLAAFGSRERAVAFARKAGAGDVVEGDGVWRVRSGPYANEEAARAAADEWQGKGYPGARATP